MAGQDGPCEPSCACAIGNEFGEATARRELKSYRKSGPPETTRWLIEGLKAGGVDGLTVLDIGAGVGAVHQDLLANGASSAVDVDGSPAFVEVAREEATRRATVDRVRYETGDFVTVADRIEPADLVVLDRVICCYPDMDALVRLSAARVRHRYGLVYPRDRWWIRAGFGVINGFLRLAGRRIRAYIHRTAAVEAIVRAEGLLPRLRRQGIFWQVAVYERTSG
jgi:magnesium-protoporphyrin O-methyltransferase